MVVRKLGILAGQGALPREVAQACREAGTPVFVIDLEGAASGWVEDFPHMRVSLGQVGRTLAALTEQGCDAVTMAGGLVRPNLSRIRFDWKGMMLLPKVALLFRKGDDGLLSGLAAMFEEQGFRVVGAETFLPSALAGSGCIAGGDPVHLSDEIALARSILGALSPYDVGQAVVVENGHCLAIEAAEGTAAMLVRVAGLSNRSERGGVLVKVPKIEQSMRVDRPAIGPDTVAQAHAAGLAGIVVAAEGVFILDRVETVRLADELGLFIHGLAP